MKAKNTEKKLEGVLVDADVYAKVKEFKEKTYMPIKTFFEQAALEKLKRESKKH